MKWSAQDIRFMRHCIDIAKKGEGKVSPNPLVGAVLVKDKISQNFVHIGMRYSQVSKFQYKNKKKISEGFHEKFGGNHAEVNALKNVSAQDNSTLYVSLEPCSHTGNGKKTPPCVPLIIKSGIKRVVIAAKDANSKVDGIKQLRRAGLQVDVGLLAKEAEEQNETFFKYMRTGKPFVVLKMAQSKNGKIGIRGIYNVRISDALFDRYVQTLRNRYDAILVGIGTVLADNPKLTCRMQGGRNPARIIVDSELSIPLNANALKNAKKEHVIIATSEKRDRKKENALEKLGANVIVCGKKEVNLALLLAKLPSLGIISVLAEGGAQIASSLMSAHLADKAIVCVSQKKMDMPETIESPFIPQIIRKLKKTKKHRMGRDLVIEGYFKY